MASEVDAAIDKALEMQITPKWRCIVYGAAWESVELTNYFGLYLVTYFLSS